MRLVSPIFTKEIIQMALSKRIFFLKVCFIFILYALILLYLIIFKNIMGTNNNLPQMGKVMMTILCFVELIIIHLIVPAITAGAINREKKDNTMSLLFLTSLSKWHIVQDKALSRLFFILFTILLTAPFIFTALLFGGVEYNQVFGAIAILISTAVILTGLTILFSTKLKSFAATLTSAYVCILIFYILSKEIFNGIDLTTEKINPFVAMGILLGDGGYLYSHVDIQSTILYMTIFAIIFYFSSIGISVLILKRSAQEKLVDSSREKDKKLGKRSYLIYHPVSLIDRKSKIIRYPLFWKNSGIIGDHLKIVLYNIVTILYIIIGFMIAAAAYADSGKEDVVYGTDADIVSDYSYSIYSPNSRYEDLPSGLDGPIILIAYLAIFFTVIYGASVISREKNNGNLQLLMTTSLNGHSFVLQSILSTLRTSIYFWSLPLLYLLFICIKHGIIDSLIIVTFIFLSNILFFTSIAIFFSTLIKRTALSVSLTLLTSFFFIFGVKIISFIIVGLFFGDGEFIYQFLQLFDQSACFYSSIETAIYDPHNFLTGSIDMMGFDGFPLILHYIIIYIFTTAFFVISATCFNQFNGRQENGKLSGLTA